MSTQSPLTVIAPIRSDRLEILKSLLAEIDKKVESNDILPFGLLETVHFARFVIIDPINAKKPSCLAFSSNYDGALDDHLDDLYDHAGVGFDRVFSNCEGYNPNDKKQFKDYILSKKRPYPNAFYVGHRGLSVKAIRQQSKIRDAIQTFLNENKQDELAPDQVKQNIFLYLKEKHGTLLSDAPPVIKLKSIWLPILVVGAILFLIAFLFGCKALFWLIFGLVLVIGFIYLILRVKETSDVQIEIKDEPELTSKIFQLTNHEDLQVQNQLTHLVIIKPGLFRFLLVRLVLWSINLLALVIFNKGKLGNIPTIHFARWVTIDNGKRLLFFSNFDGSWESYLGDFIDKAAVGLTAVWSNTMLFPKTKNLVQLGATDEERFKYWTRVHQIPTQVWYSAYKTLSVVNILNNNIIHQGLYKQMNTEECKEWLRKL